MTRTTAKKRKAEAAQPATPLEARLTEYVSALKVRDFSEHTIRNRESHINLFKNPTMSKHVFDWASS
jgi:hypothetical protein